MTIQQHVLENYCPLPAFQVTSFKVQAGISSNTREDIQVEMVVTVNALGTAEVLLSGYISCQRGSKALQLRRKAMS